MNVPALKLKANAKARVLQGHPWVFVNEVEAPLPADWDGEVVECRDRGGRFLGSGIYNSRSQIIWRRLGRERTDLTSITLRTAVEKAVGRRSGVPAASSLPARQNAAAQIRRVVWSESDSLPGVVADQYGDTVVLQIQTLAMEKRSTAIAEALKAVLNANEVIFRNDAPIRRLEGLPQEVHTLSGNVWEPRWVTIDGLDYWLDLQGGQKTGFYLDQREQHRLLAALAREHAAQVGRPLRVLDAFCNQGPFLMRMAQALESHGEFHGIDSAAEAIGAAVKNAERNKLPLARFTCANVFDWLNSAERAGEAPWDIIVLDPPPFTKKKGSMEGALRGYKEINLRALQLLAPGGLLATYTCSHHMQDADLRGVIAAAAGDARRRVHVKEWCHQPKDHPVLATMPESEYLRGYVLVAE